MIQVRKRLSANDTGETGGHQAGICIPKKPEILDFFPSLNGGERNPRVSITFHDTAGGRKWVFNFIYYNNRLFGGTRNEYRLTGMTKYLRENHLVEGDSLVFKRDNNGIYSVGHERVKTVVLQNDTLKVGSGWTVINI